MRMVSQPEYVTYLDPRRHRERMSMKPSSFCLLLFTAASCSIQDSKSESGKDSMLVGLESRYPCRQFKFESRAAPGTELSVDQRCSLVAAGYREIGQGPEGRNGVDHADTSAITSVTVAKYVFPNLDTNTSVSYWSIDFELEERPYNIQVQLDPSTGKASVIRTHK